MNLNVKKLSQVLIVILLVIFGIITTKCAEGFNSNAIYFAKEHGLSIPMYTQYFLMINHLWLNITIYLSLLIIIIGNIYKPDMFRKVNILALCLVNFFLVVWVSLVMQVYNQTIDF